MEKTEYKIYDNFLDKEDFQTIKNLMESETFPWYYIADVSHVGQSERDHRNYFYMIHYFYDGSMPKSNHIHQLKPLLDKLKAKSFIRIKGNLYPNFQENEPDEPHIDYDFSHKAAIFYLNNNNGPTILEDQTEIECKENRLLLFDGSKPHDSKYCTDAPYRLNININFF